MISTTQRREHLPRQWRRRSSNTPKRRVLLHGPICPIPMRCRETCPTLVCACMGIHYLRPLLARRYRLAAATSCVPFSARSFLVHGETSAAAARRWTAGTPLLVRGRCSPSEVLPRLPITRASFCLSHSSHRISSSTAFTSCCRLPPSVALPPRFFSHLLSLPSLLHSHFFFPFTPFLTYHLASISSSCFALVPTSCISSSVSIYTSTFVINY